MPDPHIGPAIVQAAAEGAAAAASEPSFWRKVSYRWGQALSFTAGGVFTAAGTTENHDYLVAGIAFLATGLGLRAIAVWRETVSRR